MFPYKVLRSWTVLLPAFVLIFVQAIHAQTFDFRDGQTPLATINGQWRFHAGDDAAWANPGFDDSHWSLLNTDHSWAKQGYKGYSGLAWYRMQVQLPAGHKPLALYFPSVGSSCEVFANGHLIGHIGDMPPTPKQVTMTRGILSIPDNDLVPGQPLLLAVRVWLPPIWAAWGDGGGFAAPRIGEVQTISEWSGLQEGQLHWRGTGAVIDIYNNVLTALAGLCLFALRRKEKEYLWWGMSQLLWAFCAVGNAYAAFEPIGDNASQIVNWSLFLFASYFQLEFLVTFLRQRRGVVYYVAVLSVLLATMAFISHLFFASKATRPVFDGAMVGFDICSLVFVLRATKRRNADAWILLVPYTGKLCISAMNLVTVIAFLAGARWSLALSHFLQAPFPLPFELGAPYFMGMLQMYAVLVALVRRYASSRNDEERMEAELEAARAVQRVLVPEEIPAIHGFAMQTVYKPASQVGGDFFQIIRLDSGGALIAIGDVSGKGMPAAMTVSLLVGTFRTLAHYSQSPSEILSAMNQRMLARSEGGFTTCLVLRLDPDGTLSMANAGHLYPYVNGKELDIENGLPLGIAADARYTESTCSLALDTQLTMVTDGVVEARNREGELFGFQRAAEITGEPAESIAQAALEFGQEDDITVLTVTRLTGVEETRVGLNAPELSPSRA